MKRFFCTKCRRVRRARQIPTNVKHPDNPSPKMRQGVCKLHPKHEQRATA